MAQRVVLMFLQASIEETLFVTIVMLDMCIKNTWNRFWLVEKHSV